jgi:hypothetical protein
LDADRASGLLFLMFLSRDHRTGRGDLPRRDRLTEVPFLNRWLLITAACHLAGAVWYVVKIVLRHYRSVDTALQTDQQSTPVGGDDTPGT